MLTSLSALRDHSWKKPYRLQEIKLRFSSWKTSFLPMDYISSTISAIFNHKVFIYLLQKYPYTSKNSKNSTKNFHFTSKKAIMHHVLDILPSKIYVQTSLFLPLNTYDIYTSMSKTKTGCIICLVLLLLLLLCCCCWDASDVYQVVLKAYSRPYT